MSLPAPTSAPLRPRPNHLGAVLPAPSTVRSAAALAAALLAAASTGSAALAALLVGVATASRRSGAAVLLAVLATSLRFRTAALDDLAGVQSVLGLAVEVGPATAAASAWLAAGAVLLAAAPLRAGAGASLGPMRAGALLPFLPALPCGLLAAALAAGPGPSSLGVRVATSVAGVVLAAAVVRVGGAGRPARVRPWAAVVAGVAAVVLAGWPS